VNAHPVATPRQVLRNKNFTKLLTGQFISQLGDGVVYLSLMIILNRLLGANAASAIGVLLICLTAPQVVLGLLSGVYADRLDRKKLMIFADVVRGFIALSFLLVRSPDDIWILYLGGFALSAVSAIFAPAKDASLPQLVQPDQLILANSLSQSSFIIANTLGAALAGILIGALNTVTPAIVFDAASFFISAAFISTVRLPHIQRHTEQYPSARQVGRELREGLRYVAHQRQMVGALTGIAVTMLGVGAINVLFVPFLSNDLHVPETYLGFVDLFQMAGMVLANVFVARLAARFLPAQIIGSGIILIGIFLSAAGFVQTAWVIFPLGFIWGLCLAPVEASAATVIQHAPDHIRGRTVSASQTVTGTANVLSMAVAGIAGASLGPRLAFIAGGGFAIVGGILAWLIMRGAASQSGTVSQTTPETVAVNVEE
jgi:MFS transporter, DHA3 family, macrolide efflux protein